MGGHCLVAWDRVASLDLVRLCLGGGFLAVGAFIKLVRVVIAAPRQVDALMPRCPSQQMGLEAAGGVHCIYPGRGVSRFSTPMFVPLVSSAGQEDLGGRWLPTRFLLQERCHKEPLNEKLKKRITACFYVSNLTTSRPHSAHV